MREGEEKLASFTHPDPWVNPYMPGGSRFMRNPALPLKVRRARGVSPRVRGAPVTRLHHLPPLLASIATTRRHSSTSTSRSTATSCSTARLTPPSPQIVFPPDLYPEGIPPEYNIASQDINYIQVPMSAQPEGMKTVLIDAITKRAL